MAGPRHRWPDNTGLRSCRGKPRQGGLLDLGRACGPKGCSGRGCLHRHHGSSIDRCRSLILPLFSRPYPVRPSRDFTDRYSAECSGWSISPHSDAPTQECRLDGDLGSCPSYCHPRAHAQWCRRPRHHRTLVRPPRGTRRSKAHCRRGCRGDSAVLHAPVLSAHGLGGYLHRDRHMRHRRRLEVCQHRCERCASWACSE